MQERRSARARRARAPPARPHARVATASPSGIAARELGRARRRQRATASRGTGPSTRGDPEPRDVRLPSCRRSTTSSPDAWPPFDSTAGAPRSISSSSARDAARLGGEVRGRHSRERGELVDVRQRQVRAREQEVADDLDALVVEERGPRARPEHGIEHDRARAPCAARGALRARAARSRASRRRPPRARTWPRSRRGSCAGNRATRARRQSTASMRCDGQRRRHGGAVDAEHREVPEVRLDARGADRIGAADDQDDGAIDGTRSSTCPPVPPRTASRARPSRPGSTGGTAPRTPQRRRRGSGRPSRTSAGCAAAGAPHTTQIARFFVTYSASTMSSAIVWNGPRQVVLLEAGDDHALAAVGELAAHRDEVGLEELGLVDPDDLHGVGQVREDLVGARDRLRREALRGVRHDVVVAVAAVDRGLVDLHRPGARSRRGGGGGSAPRSCRRTCSRR